MYGNDDIKFLSHMETADTIQSESRVIAEWNMNVPGNIKEVGNYRNRANDIEYPEMPDEWNENDPYTDGATDADTTIYTPLSNEDGPMAFTEPNKKMELLYSLDDCVKHHRPRSGINKPLYLGYTASDSLTAQYVNNYGSDIDKRPRYYMGSRYDSFKYWTSYRTENGNEYGISDESGYIEDVAPYVVYENPVPTNRIVIKMQTNVGTVDQGPFRVGMDDIEDPLFGMDKSTVPAVWSVQTLSEANEWETIAALTSDNIGPDGHIQLSLGWKLPDNYRLKGTMPNFAALPISGKNGDTYFVEDENTFYTYERPTWSAVAPALNWGVDEESFNNKTPVVTNLTNPREEVAYIHGIRIVVDLMNKANQTFDLIEMSPRLVVDITDRTSTFNISRTMADLGSKTLPIGDVLVSTGTIDLNNNDGAFSHESKDSILTPYLFNKIKFNFYETVKMGDEVKTIPLKTLYSQGFPQATGNFDSVTMQMRDAYSILESEQAPELFLQDISLSFAVVMLLDSIGFSNYKFLRLPEETETIIPFFFVGPGRSVAEVLKDLAIATQTSMWFNENNDFCVGSKRWALPDSNERNVDMILRGNETVDGMGIPDKLPNIINISSDEKRVANDGSINYTERYLQREKQTLEQSTHTNAWQNWIYKASMLWEASADENLREYNTTAKTGKSYNLTAIPLETDLPTDLPEVTVDGRLINNIIDFGEGITWLARTNGYFYANGEIIKFSGVEYVITGTGVRWLYSNDDYQDYLGSLPFGGKIYPSGRVQIYAEPYYNEDGSFEVGPVKEHGRAQFGTERTEHLAGLGEFWKDNNNCYGMLMDSEILFTADHVREYPTDMNPPSAITNQEDVNVKAHASSRTGIIKNFYADTYQVEKENQRFNTTRRGTIQSSALVFEGPADYTKVEVEGSLVETKSVDNISYILTDFAGSSPYRHFGTRMRVIGEIQSQSNTKQRATGAQEYVSLQPENPSEAVNVIGGSGGLGVMVNPDNNEGYFFEIVALSQDAYNRSSTNPIYKATATVRNKTVSLRTQAEHNIQSGDEFLIMDAPLGSNLDGQWEAKGVNTSKDTVTLRIEDAPDSTGEVYIQKLEEQAATMSTLFFYKMMETQDGKLMPYVLWEGITEIIVDDGKSTDIQRSVGQEKSSVYDVGVEYKDINGVRRFYLYLNGKQIGSIDDIFPIENPRNTMAVFTRGKSKCMFNNVYALADRFSENTAAKVTDQISNVFGIDSITNTEAMRKYSMTGFIQQSYLSSIGTESSPDYNMYFDEFGTIMRECAYLNIKYDQAYPALAATLAPVINDNKSYVTSGFIAGAYGAEFLIFNTTDTTINLDAETGNFLRIQGVSFTQDTTKELTVDDYYGQVARLDRPKMRGDRLLGDPTKYKEQYEKIQASRAQYGRQEFESLSSEYIQDDSVAEDMLSWIVNKTMKPRQLIGANLFGVSHMQLGDIVRVDYEVQPTEAQPMEAITSKDKNFVVYQFDYTKTLDGINTTAYLVEV